jgi:serine/threonine-protein kinase
VADPNDVRAALDRVLAADEFKNASRLSRFLRFVVERALAGEAGELKEYRIGAEVFDRGDAFDPRVDPIVRVEARRLRAKLLEYYDGAGAGSPLRIVLPKGGYAPLFEPAPSETAPPESVPRPSRRWVWLAVLALGITATVITLGSRIGPEPLTILVIPAPEPEVAEFADSLAEAVSVELSRQPRLRVVAWPLFLEYRRQHPGLVNGPIRQATLDLRAEAVLYISVRRLGERYRITAHFMNPDEGWKRQAGDYERSASGGFEVQRETARSIADEVAASLARK